MPRFLPLALLALCSAAFLNANVTHEWGMYDYFDTDTYFFIAPQDDPFYEERCWEKLSHYGEKHTRRGSYIVDVGCVRPKKGEPYEDFRERVMNTLTMQNYNRRMLDEAIDRTRKKVEELKGELEKVQNASQKLESTLGAMRKGERVRVRTRQSPFQGYTVQPGDTLQSIANNKYGTNTAWLAIYRFNQSVLPDGPNNIEIGDFLWLPNERR